MQSPFADGSIILLLLFFVFGVIAMVAVVGLQAINSRSAAVWTKPDWRVNPFSLKQPLQFFHMAGFYCIVAGFSAIVLTQIRHVTGLEPLFPAALGAGILIGIRCCVALYQRKFPTNI
jgi:hypothetical protein